ncbi:hypothetical protein YC2023_072861 [Brassica napus]
MRGALPDWGLHKVVCDYLNETVASTQTLESVTTFSNKCKDFKLTKVEILNIINIRPSVDFKALLDPIIAEPKERGIDIDGILKLKWKKTKMKQTTLECHFGSKISHYTFELRNALISERGYWHPKTEFW